MSVSISHDDRPMPPLTTISPRRVAIVGGGASGALAALNILRSGKTNVDVTVFEAASQVGLGIAYSTTDGHHLLNVRAGNMSAFVDAPNDLVDWAAAAGIPLTATDFLPRRDFGRYLQDRLAAAAEAHPNHYHVVTGLITDLTTNPVVEAASRAGLETTPTYRLNVNTPSGQQTYTGFDTVILAYGNLPLSPLTVGGQKLLDAPWHLENPWDLQRLNALPANATIILVGTGLTSVDLAITLLDGYPDRRVIMVSRNGLMPAAHVNGAHETWATTLPATNPAEPLTADTLANHFEAQVKAAKNQGIGWRAVVDGLRPSTQAAWQALSPIERARFLTEYARHWEVRRHRMAPQIADKIEGFLASSQLIIRSGGILAVTPDADKVKVQLPADTILADAIVNCTGPAPESNESANPLLNSLFSQGLAAPSPLGLGIQATPDGQVTAADGQPIKGLYVIGPPLKGVVYESTAIPEIRAQAAALTTQFR